MKRHYYIHKNVGESRPFNHFFCWNEAHTKGYYMYRGEGDIWPANPATHLPAINAALGVVKWGGQYFKVPACKMRKLLGKALPELKE